MEKPTKEEFEKSLKEIMHVIEEDTKEDSRFILIFANVEEEGATASSMVYRVSPMEANQFISQMLDKIKKESLKQFADQFVETLKQGKCSCPTCTEKEKEKEKEDNVTK